MIISLDCSTTCVGWSVFENDELLVYGKLTPTVKELQQRDKIYTTPNAKELQWRDRVYNLIPQINQLLSKYKPTECYLEDVPKGGSGGNLVLSELYCVQGNVMTLMFLNNIPLHLIPVSQWRKDIGINDGDKNRDSKKIRSIQKANEVFDLDLKCVFTPSGKYDAKKSDDDIADSIWVYASTLKKYQVKKGKIGRR